MTEYQYKSVAQTLGPKLLVKCPSCGEENTLRLLDGFHLIQIHSAPRTTIAADSVIPTVIVGCNNCGVMQYHNVHTLGVSEVLGIPKAGEEF